MESLFFFFVATYRFKCKKHGRVPQDALTFAGCGWSRGDAMYCAGELTQEKREKKVLIVVSLKDECVDMILGKPS